MRRPHERRRRSDAYKDQMRQDALDYRRSVEGNSILSGTYDTLADYMTPESAAGTTRIADVLLPFYGGAATVEEGIDTLREAETMGDYLKGAAYTGLGALEFAPVVGALAKGAKTARGAQFLAEESGMFAGIGAKTADLGALGRAEEMAALGRTRDDIWNETGWFQGVDGKWRFEIDDSTSRIRNRTNEIAVKKRGDLGKSFQHDDLFRAYPQFENMPLGVEYARASEVNGTYRGLDDGISISPFTLRNREDARSVMLHELQHAVQDAEGFARGGNVGIGKQIANDNLWNQAFRAQDKLDAAVRELPEEYRRQWEMYQSLGGDRKWEMQDRMMMNDVLSPVLDLEFKVQRFGEMAQEGADADAAFYAYQDLAGEVEARNVQRRRAGSAEYPWKTQDVPDQRQIVRLRGAGGNLRIKDLLEQ